LEPGSTTAANAGHVIPALSDETFESLETFLKEQQLAAEEADSLATSLESSRL